MSVTTPLAFPLFKAWTSTGSIVPLVGGKLYTYAAGTTTPLAAYQDPALTILHANPIILDAYGQATIYLGVPLYKLELQDPGGVVQPGFPIDNVSVPVTSANAQALVDVFAASLANTADAAKGDALVGVKQPYAGATAQTQHRKNLDNITALDFGAIGDGTTNDTAAFLALETAVPLASIDLQGKTHKVDAQPTGCIYSNGAFKLSSEPRVFLADRENIAGKFGSEMTLNSQTEDARYVIDPALRNSVILLGDSISHGAHQGDLYQNGWVNIFKRMLRAETGTYSYGYAPLIPLSNGSIDSAEVHTTAFSPGHAWTPNQSADTGKDILQGLTFTSSVAGNYITITCPTFQTGCRIWYVTDPSYGVFKWSVNGGATTNIDTAAARNTIANLMIPMTDNGAGGFTIKIEVVSGSVTFGGVSWETVGGGVAGPCLHNFSQSGRRLYLATEDMIEKACQGSALILCLGYNDSASCDADPAYNTEFQQRIDWIVEYCLKYNTTLIVPDFCWWSLPTNKARAGLKRAATQTRGVYIPLPELLTRDGMLKYEYGDSYYLVDALKKWADQSHPNRNGGKWIAETVAKWLGFSCSSKSEALRHNDWAWPVQILPGSPFKNEQTSIPYISTFQRSGDVLTLNLRIITKTGASPGALAASILNTVPSALLSRQITLVTSAATTPGIPIQVNPSTFGPNVVASISNSCEIKLDTTGTPLAVTQAAIAMPFDSTLKIV